MTIKSLLTVLAVLVLTACAGGDTVSVAAPGQPGGDGPPGRAVAQARVPIAGVEGGAAGVNNGRKTQAPGLQMTKDLGKGSKADDITDTALAGGCVPGYGQNGACLPPVPPSLVLEHAGHSGMLGEEMANRYTCAEVRALIPGGIVVTGADTLGLDSNGDKIACGSGDD